MPDDALDEIAGLFERDLGAAPTKRKLAGRKKADLCRQHGHKNAKSIGARQKMSATARRPAPVTLAGRPHA
jgi:hypothetical protein